MLQIRSCNRDNVGISFLIFPLKKILTHHENRLTEIVLMKGHHVFIEK